MNRRAQKVRFRARPLWKRILDRHKFKGHLLRVRIPLVLLRLRSVERSQRICSQRAVGPYLLNLHLQLSWPRWLISTYSPATEFENSTFLTTVTRDLNWPVRALARTRKRTPRNTRAARNLQETRQVVTPYDAPGKRSEDDEIQGGWRGLGALSLSLSKGTIEPFNQFISIARRGMLSAPVNASTRRLLTRKIFTNQLQNFFIGSDVFVPRGVRSISAQRTDPSHVGKVAIDVFKDSRVQQFEFQKRIQHREPNDLRKRVLTGHADFVHRALTNGDDRSLENGRSRLYSQPASLAFVTSASSGSATRSEPAEPKHLSRPAAPVQNVQPQLDIPRLSEEVYRHIQRKIRVERERRGL